RCFFVIASFGNIARYLHAHSSSVGPRKNAVMDFEPALSRRRENFNTVIGETPETSAKQFSMSASLGTEKASIGPIGEQKLQSFRRIGDDRDRIVQAFQHGHESFVGSR